VVYLYQQSKKPSECVSRLFLKSALRHRQVLVHRTRHKVFKRFGEISMLCLWEGTVALEASETCWKGAPFPQMLRWSQSNEGSVALSVLLVLDGVCTACVFCCVPVSSMIASFSFRHVMLLLLG